MTYKVFCIGNQWRGSDDGSLFRAFSRAGHLINIVDDKFFVPADVTSFIAKAVRKIGAPFFLRDFNAHVVKQFDGFNPDIVFVYKGFSLFEETLMYFKRKGVPVFCVYPDVSFYDHGPNIPLCIPHYDFIFTTKSFGLDDLRVRFNYTRTMLIQHCVDPDIHRFRGISLADFPALNCDASFIGSFSAKKEGILHEVISQLPDYQLKIWGAAWDKTKFENVREHWEKQPVYGDMYAVAINCSKVNIAILSEPGSGASSGDLVTSRTFHIPGCGGFMLHERTQEFLQLFQEGVEAECFQDQAELVDKIRYYIKHETRRHQIAARGHVMVMAHHTSDHRVKEIIGTLQEQGMLKKSS